jgi:hypothetical protein
VDSIALLIGLGILVGVRYSYNRKRCHCMWKRPLSLESSGKDMLLQELYGIVTGTNDREGHSYDRGERDLSI